MQRASWRPQLPAGSSPPSGVSGSDAKRRASRALEKEAAKKTKANEKDKEGSEKDMSVASENASEDANMT